MRGFRYRLRRDTTSKSYAVATLSALLLVAFPGSASAAFGEGNGAVQVVRAVAATQTFGAVADSWVKSDSASSNYGTSTSLRVDAVPVARAYVKFDLSALAGTVTKASLRLYATTGSRVGVSVRSSSAGWGERTITWANAPAPSTTARASGAFSSKAWKTIDVTPFVAGGRLVSLVLTTSS